MHVYIYARVFIATFSIIFTFRNYISIIFIGSRSIYINRYWCIGTQACVHEYGSSTYNSYIYIYTFNCMNIARFIWYWHAQARILALERVQITHEIIHLRVTLHSIDQGNVAVIGSCKVDLIGSTIVTIIIITVVAMRWPRLAVFPL